MVGVKLVVALAARKIRDTEHIRVGLRLLLQGVVVVKFCASMATGSL